MATVVADTSPLIALHQLGQLSLLQRIFGEIHVPPAVAREIIRRGFRLSPAIREKVLADAGESA
jgi:predicted nucleic acid-binding protein